MRTIQVHKKELDPSDYTFRDAKESDYKTLIKDECILMDGDKIVAVYVKVKNSETQQIRDHIRSVKCSPDRRSKGLIVNAAVFGYTPRKTLTRDYCSSSMMSHNNPLAHAAVCKFGETLATYYKKLVPQVYADHEMEVKYKVRKEWIIENTPFTSGIINKDSALRYHFDTGNFKNVYSNMLALKRGVSGGHLALPEYNVGLDISDNSILLFDGQKILHGVTPIHKVSPEAYRYTIVYYTLQKMWKCVSPQGELERVKRVKSLRETKRYKMLTGEIAKTI